MTAPSVERGQAGCASALGNETTALGPGSLTWRLFGDRRSALLVLRTATLQAMHPAIAAALIDHSSVFENPWHRLWRSAPQILQTVYGPQPNATGARIRDFHRSVHGTDGQGRRYHALDPEVYHWAHATFFESQIATAQLFGEPLSWTQKEQLYEESLVWYGRYGITAKPAPVDYGAFLLYWERVVCDVLEPTDVACWGLAHTGSWPAPVWWMRGPLWLMLRRPAGACLASIARGTLGPDLRQHLELRWTPADERRLLALARAVRALWRVLPADLQLASAARSAYRRESAAATWGHAHGR